MEILVIGWNSFGVADIVITFIKLGFEVDFFDYPLAEAIAGNNLSLGEKVVKRLTEKKYAFVFSTNFFTQVALSCNACKVRYVSWVYDSPCPQLYASTLAFPYTYAFSFDQAMCRDLNKKGIDHIYYLPMAAPVEKYDSYILTEEEKDKYKGDIVFVGSTYSEERNDWIGKWKGISEYAKGYLDGLIEAQKKVYGTLFLEQCLPPGIVAELERVQGSPRYPDSIFTKEWFYALYVLARRITALERKEILSLLADGHDVHLYTHEETPWLKGVVNHGKAEISREAILIYKAAKINLNITLRSIETGIPLRVMDIMGSGGFVLTNFQEDMLEHFEPGVDFVYYEDYEDLVRKTDYYLEHEEERKEIARSGYEKVKQFHTYEKRIEEMLAVLATESEMDI